MRTSLVFATLVLGVALPASAQTEAQPPAPPTKLEAFMTQEGVALVHGSSPMGEIHGRDGGLVVVAADEVTDTGTGERRQGLTITVRAGGTAAASRASLVDFDEIDSLAVGIDTIAKVDRSSTPMANVRADYRTRDGLRISAHVSGQQVRVAVSSGHRNRVTAWFPWSELAKLKDLVVQGKAALESLRQ
jgi:hypothetical protein